MISLIILICGAIILAFPLIDVGIAIIAIGLIVKFIRWIFRRNK